MRLVNLRGDRPYPKSRLADVNLITRYDAPLRDPPHCLPEEEQLPLSLIRLKTIESKGHEQACYINAFYAYYTLNTIYMLFEGGKAITEWNFLHPSSRSLQEQTSDTTNSMHTNMSNKMGGLYLNDSRVLTRSMSYGFAS
jgi:hypothetical protein